MFFFSLLSCHLCLPMFPYLYKIDTTADNIYLWYVYCFSNLCCFWMEGHSINSLPLLYKPMLCPYITLNQVWIQSHCSSQWVEIFPESFSMHTIYEQVRIWVRDSGNKYVMILIITSPLKISGCSSDKYHLHFTTFFSPF